MSSLQLGNHIEHKLHIKTLVDLSLRGNLRDKLCSYKC